MHMTLEEINAEIAMQLCTNQKLIIGNPIFTQESWYYHDNAARLIAGAFFTTELHFIISITNKASDYGKLEIISGSFESTKIMTSTCDMVFSLFADADFRLKRRILMDYGKMLVSLMHNIDQPAAFNDTLANTMNIQLRIYQYEQLEDVEYIEDIMQEFISRNTTKH